MKRDIRAPRRRRGPARWLILGLSGLATAGFFGAILNGPSPTNANRAPAEEGPQIQTQAPAVQAASSSVVGPSNAPSIGSSASAGSSARSTPSLIGDSAGQSQTVARTPRFRTRGS